MKVFHNLLDEKRQLEHIQTTEYFHMLHLVVILIQLSCNTSDTRLDIDEKFQPLALRVIRIVVYPNHS
jgi:hypothetical protein